MGSFFTSVQLRGVDRSRGAQLVRDCSLMPAYVSGNDQWLGIYPWATDEQNEEDLRIAAKRLSAEAKAVAVAMLVHDSDVLLLYVYEQGKEIDAYNSCH